MPIKKLLSGTSARSLIFAELMAFSAVTATVGYGLFHAYRTLPAQVSLADDLSGDPPSPMRPSGCTAKAIVRDAGGPIPGKTCYVLGEGAGDFNASEETQDLAVEVGPGATPNRITTGSGDDDIFISLARSPEEASLKIDPGAGANLVDVIARPGVLAKASLATGTGILRANLICGAGAIDLEVSAGSQSFLGGDCPLRARVTEPGPARTSIRAVGGAFFDANLEGLANLELDVAVNASGQEVQAQALALKDLAYGEIRYRAQSDTPVSFSLSGQDMSPSSSIFVDIGAPDGRLWLSDVAQEKWHIHADYARGGEIVLTFPPEESFDAMVMPALTGRADTLEIRGCFDQVLLISGREITRRLEGCTMIGEANLRLSPSDTIRTLALVRRGEITKLRLGKDALDVTVVKLRRGPGATDQLASPASPVP